jgi:DNA-binding XRE family transcriptional regulator
MPEPTKKHPTDELIDLRLRVHRCNVDRIKRYAATLEGAERTFTVAEAFPDLLEQEPQIALRAYRQRENLTQLQLAERTGIPQHHISEMENGKRSIGRERAKRLATALNCDYRRLL